MLVLPLFAFGQARTVKVIAIEFTGKVNGTDAAKIARCEKFKPTLQQTKTFFNRADYIPKATMPAEGEAPCYASGILLYSDGSKATWTLYANGFASLWLMRGEEISLRYENNTWCNPLSNVACSKTTTE